MESATADDVSKAGGGDGHRIDLTDDNDIHGWSERLGVSALELQAAVEKVGPVVEDVRRFLGK